MIPTNVLRNFTKYEVITTTRQSDGAKLTATRVAVVEDIALPVRWDIEVTNPQPSTFVAPERSVTESLSNTQSQILQII